jgi:hypothetical protein
MIINLKSGQIPIRVKAGSTFRGCRHYQDVDWCASPALARQAVLDGVATFDPLVGMRVILTEDVDNWPTVLVSKGATGVVASADDERVMVTLDEYRRELDEWENQLEIFFHDRYDDGLPLAVVLP